MKVQVWFLAAIFVAGACVGASAQKLRAGSSFRDCNTVCPEMVVIPAGHFAMGSPASEGGRESDEDQHDVSIGYSLAVGKYEVTREEFAAFVVDTHYDAKGT